MNTSKNRFEVTRRDFLGRSGLVVAGLSCGRLALGAEEKNGKGLSFGIVTDSHYADRPPGGRVYRESLKKMTECVELMNEKKVSFLVELGDFKDQGKPAAEASTLEYLSAIEKVFTKFKGPRYHVLGNHDVDSISKRQFSDRVENTGIDKNATYYSYDCAGLHFVVLDACFDGKGVPYDHGKFKWTDANIPPVELDWLKKDLASTAKPVILFIHQQLCGEGSHYVNNAPEVREILGRSGNVLAVFQGHNHRGGCKQIEGIHYYTLKAMVDGAGETNNSYAIVHVNPDRSITVTGYRKAVSKELAKA